MALARVTLRLGPQLDGARAAVAAVGAAALGAAPHVLHHAGPLAGAALFAGAAGRCQTRSACAATLVPTLR